MYHYSTGNYEHSIAWIYIVIADIHNIEITADEDHLLFKSLIDMFSYIGSNTMSWVPLFFH